MNYILISPHQVGVTSTLRNLTSILNPILYAGSDPKLKALLRQLLCGLDEHSVTGIVYLSIHYSLKKFYLLESGVNDPLLISMVLKGWPSEYKPLSFVVMQADSQYTFHEFKVALPNFE